MKLNNSFTLRTVRKKILVMTKFAGILLVFSYIFSTRLPIEPDLSFAVWLIFVLLMVLMIDFLMGYFVSNPVSQLNEAAHRMADLDFSSPCKVTTNDEFGELSVNLNRMAENLQHALEGLNAVNERLEKDVERERRLLDERKELTDHLSHEMKTPLGVIRAYAEGLQDETDEFKKKKYTDIIIEETERMNVLITTLLDLSALESGASKLQPERFEFVDFTETVAGRLLVDIPDADFKLEYELPEREVFVSADKARMEQVLGNLITNARKNVKAGGVLKLSLTEQAGELKFAVFNQGPKIAEENLTKIWTKFYRNKSSGYSGSGLGLAMVSQILSMQNLEYGVTNLSEGVQFYFVIPIIN